MAVAEQLKILSKGPAAWNKWRDKHPNVSIDLSKAKLSRAHLGGANLNRADLSRANLNWADLSGADLGTANLNHAELGGADLGEADLSGANLREAILLGADLGEAVLIRADLRRATLIRADLREAVLLGADLGEAELLNASLSRANLSDCRLTEARLASTNFGQTSLKGVKGLETCIHRGPSVIDYHTLMESGPLPEVFLRGCGLSNEFIHYLPCFWNQPFEFYSCFISYSHADKSFARRLHDTLQGRGIRCWLDEHQLLPGDHVHKVVDEAVRLWDKVLLCCSQDSLTSWWVDKEIQKALMKEERLSKERGKEVLAIIPLNLDGYMLKLDWQNWKQQHVISRLAADFTDWKKDDDKFNEQVEKVIKALRADNGARPPAPKPRL
jgi:TIR domain/Pentapeptide repeats (8 copies)